MVDLGDPRTIAWTGTERETRRNFWWSSICSPVPLTAAPRRWARWLHGGHPRAREGAVEQVGEKQGRREGEARHVGGLHLTMQGEGGPAARRSRERATAAWWPWRPLWRQEGDGGFAKKPLPHSSFSAFSFKLKTAPFGIYLRQQNIF